MKNKSHLKFMQKKKYSNSNCHSFGFVVIDFQFKTLNNRIKLSESRRAIRKNAVSPSFIPILGIVQKRIKKNECHKNLGPNESSEEWKMWECSGY